MAWADLKEANLIDADLRFADLTGASLRKAKLILAKLMETKLSEAVLVKANLTAADLTGADLVKSDLSEAKLINVKASNAKFQFAKFCGTIFEPRPGTLPILEDIMNARCLPEINYETNSDGLKELREIFRKVGLDKQVKMITFAIRKREREFSLRSGSGWDEKFEGLFNLTFFELTSDYGMTPGKPIRLLGILLLLFAVPYFFVLLIDHTSYIEVVLPVTRSNPGVRTKAFRLNGKHSRRISRAPRALKPILQVLRILRISFYFSAMSAIRIGWGEFNFENWFTDMQFRDYLLRARGWARTVRGVQSLISIYLLALWAFISFGGLFE